MNGFLSILCLKANGDIKTIRKNGTLLRTYFYDQAGQWTQEINHKVGGVDVYHYDADGNLSYCNSEMYHPDHITELWKDKLEMRNFLTYRVCIKEILDAKKIPKKGKIALFILVVCVIGLTVEEFYSKAHTP